MDAILICVDEIALEGLDGCTLERLWKTLENRTPAFPMRIDSASKEFLWRGIVHCEELEFFVTKKILVSEVLKEDDKNVCKDSDLDVEIYPFKIVNDNGVRGSSSQYEERENISSEVRGENGECLCSLEKAKERWSDYLTIVASQELRDTAIFGADGDTTTPVQDLQYCLLEHIARSRYRGRIQKFISTYFFQFDPKSTFHHLKKLQKKGLITRQQFVISKGGGKNFLSNIVLLKRFHSVRHHKYDILGEKICSIIDEAPGKEMSMVDLQRHMNKQGYEINRKLLRRVRDYLVETGYIEGLKRNIDKYAVDLSFSTTPQKKKKKLTTEKETLEIEFLKLIKPFLLSNSEETRKSNDDDDFDNDDYVDEDSDDEEKLLPVPRDKSENIDQVLVAERTWFWQTYDIIEKAGQRGLTMTETKRKLKLPRLDVRLMVTLLKKQGYIKCVVQAKGKGKIAFHVATPYYESSSHLKMIQEEQMKLKAMKENLAITKPLQESVNDSVKELSCEMATKDESSDGNIDAICTASLSGGPDLVEVGAKRNVKRSKLASQVTHRALRRKTFIVELLKSSKVIDGQINILKALQKHEENLGIGKVDRRTVSVILESLLSDGLIKKVKTVVRHAGISVPVEFFLHSLLEADHPMVLSKIDQIRFKLFDREKQLKERLETRKKKEDAKQTIKSPAKSRNAKKVKRLAAGDASTGTEEETNGSLSKKPSTSTETSTVEEGLLVHHDSLKKGKEGKVVIHYLPGNAEKYGYQRKFARAQILHEFIWQVVYGLGSKRGPSGIGRKEAEFVDLPSSAASNDMTSAVQSMQETTQNDADYDWVSHVASLPLYDAGSGWFCLVDIIPIMPLSMFCKVVGVTFEVEGLDEYFFDSSKKNTLLRELPGPLRSSLTAHCKCDSAIKETAITMCAMGLLTPKHPIPPKKVEVMCHLSEGATIVDTTTSVPSHRRVSAPTGSQFPKRAYIFSDFEKVKSYWWDIKCVCLNTPLGIFRSKDSDIKTSKNKFKLEVFTASIRTTSNIGLPPGDGLGSAGLDIDLYSHLWRNWFCVANKKNLMASSKKRSFSEVKAPEIKKIVTEKKSIKKGGKDEKRNVIRKKRKPDGVSEDNGMPKPKKPRKIIQAQPPLDKEPFSSGYVAVDDIDQEALKKKKRMRIYFSPEEDSLILLCRVAQGIMKRSDRSIYPYKGWRRVLHETFESSEDKTAPSIHRRICRLLKNPTNRHNCKICVAECRDDEEFNGFDDPDLPFEETLIEVVKRLKLKYRSTDLSSAAELNLFTTLKELHENYTIEPLCSEKPFPMSSDQLVLKSNPSALSANDVRLRNIRNLIQSAFLTPQDEHDAYRLFSMFGAHADKDLEKVFVEMLSDGLLTRKRCPNISDHFTRSLPCASMTYRLSFGYFKLFESSVSFNIVNDCRTFIKQLEKGKYCLDNISEAGISDEQTATNPVSLVFKEESTLGAHVASLLSLLASDQLTVETLIPDEIIELEMDDLENESIDNQLEDSDDSDNEQESRNNVQAKKNRKTVCSGREVVSKETTFKNKKNVSNEQAKKRKIAQTAGESIPIQKSQNLGKKIKTAQESLSKDSTIKTQTVVSLHRNESASSSSSSNVDFVPSKTREISYCNSTSSGDRHKVADKATFSNNSSSGVEGVTSIFSSERMNKDKESSQSMQDCVPCVVSKTPSENDNLSKERHHQKETPESSLADTMDDDTSNQSSIVKYSPLSQVFTLKTLAPVRCKFTSPNNLSSSQTLCPYLHCSVEPWGNKDGFNATPGKVPVALVSNTSLSRASRTSLFIARGKQTVQRAAQMLTTRAFNTHDVVSINNCHLKLMLKSRVGQEIRPVESASNRALSGRQLSGSSVASTSKETSIVKQRLNLSPVIVPELHEVLTIDEYTARKLGNPGFNDADRALATFIHNAVYKEGELGLPLNTLEGLAEEKKQLFKAAFYSLSYHCTMMCTFKMIFKVGLYHTRFVCTEFAKLWCAKLLKQKEKRPKGSAESECKILGNKCHLDSEIQLVEEDKLNNDLDTVSSKSSNAVVKAPAETGAPKGHVELKLYSTSTHQHESENTTERNVSLLPKDNVNKGITNPNSGNALSGDEGAGKKKEASTESQTTQGAFPESQCADEKTSYSPSSNTSSFEVQSAKSTFAEGQSTQGMSPDSQSVEEKSSDRTTRGASLENRSVKETSDDQFAQGISHASQSGEGKSSNNKLAREITGKSQDVEGKSSDDQFAGEITRKSQSVEGKSSDDQLVREITRKTQSVEGKSSDDQLARQITRKSQSVEEKSSDGQIARGTSSQGDEEGLNPIFVISRPWVSCDGSVNQKTFRMVEEAVALCIMQKPGIREDELFLQFGSAVYPVALNEILEILQAKGCITKHIHTVYSTPTLFSKVPKTKEEPVPFYLPTLDCILRLATEDW